MEVFIPWRILEDIESTGSGSFNYKGIDTLHKSVTKAFPEETPENEAI